MTGHEYLDTLGAQARGLVREKIWPHTGVEVDF
jgi:hypothetical protein